MGAPSLTGRERETRRIVSLLDDVHERGATLVLESAAGMGKSSLLAEALAVARSRGMQVLSTAGVRSEANLPFAGLHQLLRPILGRLGDLPAPQRAALRTAFGMEDGAAPELFLTALGALGLLTDVAAGRPLLVTVEDAHWLDGPSADALAFLGRRIEADPIVMLVAIREGYEHALRDAGLPELRLDGLADEAAGRLLRARFPDLPERAHPQLVAVAGGNPLALLELGAGRDDGDLPSTGALPARLERAFAARAAELPPATRTLLRVAAVSEDDSLATVLAAAELVDGVVRTIDDLVPAIQAHLVEVDGHEVRFRHPLVKSAIDQAATVADRRSSHAALADVCADDPDRSAWHRAAAAVGPDRGVASDLEEAGHRARRRGAVATAAAAFERAAALSPDRSDRGRLLLDAAAMTSELGRGATVLRLLRDAEPMDLGPLGRARLALLEDGFREGRMDDPVRVRELVARASAVAASGELDLALDLLTAAASRCYWGDLLAEGQDVVQVAERLGHVPGDQRRVLIQAFAAPVDRCGVILGQLERMGPPEDAAGLYLHGMAACLAGALDRASPLLGEAAQRLREQGRLRMLAQVLSIRAWTAIELGDFATAIPSAEESANLWSETENPLWQTGARVAQATLAALRGDRATVEALATEVERLALPRGARALLGLIRYARGLLELGEGRHAAAYAQLRRLADGGDPGRHHLILCHAVADVAEAASHSGHVDEARALLRDVEPLGRGAPSPWFALQLAVARVHLAPDDGAEERFAEALALDLAGSPMMRARIELARGAWLRRRRRRREARIPLRAARDTFDALGMAPWAERARRELRAAGEASEARRHDALDDLTPQELQIVQLAAQGLSNREIAQQLYLSHRTVESHMYRVFPKLGVTSRSQLKLRGFT